MEAAQTHQIKGRSRVQYLLRKISQQAVIVIGIESHSEILGGMKSGVRIQRGRSAGVARCVGAVIIVAIADVREIHPEISREWQRVLRRGSEVIARTIAVSLSSLRIREVRKTLIRGAMRKLAAEPPPVDLVTGEQVQRTVGLMVRALFAENGVIRAIGNVAYGKSWPIRNDRAPASAKTLRVGVGRQSEVGAGDAEIAGAV